MLPYEVLSVFVDLQGITLDTGREDRDRGRTIHTLIVSIHHKNASHRMRGYVLGRLYALLSCHHKPNGEGIYGLIVGIPEALSGKCELRLLCCNLQNMTTKFSFYRSDGATL